MRWFLAAAVVAFLGAGCAQTFDARGVAVPVTMASQGVDTVDGTPFSVKAHSTYVFWGLWSIDPPKLDRILASQLVGGSEIRNVRIRTKFRFLDLFLTAITAGIYSQKSITYEGEIISVPAPSESQ
jgi:hypothetical protein